MMISMRFKTFKRKEDFHFNNDQFNLKSNLDLNYLSA